MKRYCIAYSPSMDNLPSNLMIMPLSTVKNKMENGWQNMEKIQHEKDWSKSGKVFINSANFLKSIISLLFRWEAIFFTKSQWKPTLKTLGFSLVYDGSKIQKWQLSKQNKKQLLVNLLLSTLMSLPLYITLCKLLFTFRPMIGILHILKSQIKSNPFQEVFFDVPQT